MKAKRKESERTKFERWLSDWIGYEPIENIRSERSEFGYEIPDWDIAFSAWCARAELGKTGE